MQKILAFILTLILVFPLLLAALALTSVNSFILDRDFYVQSLDNEQFYDSLISDSAVSAILGAYLNIPTIADTTRIDAVVKSVITRDYLKVQVNNYVNGIFDYLQGKTDKFEPALDLKPIKTALAGEKQDEFLAAIAAILPLCEPGQTPGIDTMIHMACKPAGLSDEVLAQDYIKPILPIVISQIPDLMPIGENWIEIRSTGIWGLFASGVAVSASLILVTVFLVFMAVSIWYITALIADASWRMRLLWLGWSLIVPSGLIFLASLALSADIPRYWLNLGIERAASNNAFLNMGLHETLRVVINNAVPRAARSIMITGGISSALSLGLIFWGLATPKQKHDG